MKVSINKLMRHPSHETNEVGVVDIYEDTEISSCIEEMMAVITCIYNLHSYPN